MATLPSAVQDLTRFFLNLTGSSSLGAVGGVAGVAAPASGVGVQLCPLVPGGGAVAPCAATAVLAGVVVLLLLPLLCPARQQRQETSRSSRRRRCSSSDGTARVSKKRPRGRSPSPSRPSCYWERSYRSSSESSEDVRAETSPPRAGRAPGGMPGDSCPAPAGGRSPRPGPSVCTARSSVGADRYRSGGGRRSPRLRVWRMTTVPVPLIWWTLTGMTLSGLSWPSLELSQHGRAGRDTISLVQDFSCIDLWFNVGDLSGISLAHLSLDAIAAGRH